MKVALTETSNAFSDMPDTMEELPKLKGRLGDIRKDNVDHHIMLIESAAKQGVRVVGLGELFTAPYFGLSKDEIWFGMAEDASSGETVKALSAAAARRVKPIVRWNMRGAIIPSTLSAQRRHSGRWVVERAHSSANRATGSRPDLGSVWAIEHR